MTQPGYINNSFNVFSAILSKFMFFFPVEDLRQRFKTPLQRPWKGTSPGREIGSFLSHVWIGQVWLCSPRAECYGISVNWGFGAVAGGGSGMGSAVVLGGSGNVPEVSFECKARFAFGKVCSQGSFKGLLNGIEFSTWMQCGCFAFLQLVLLLGKCLFHRRYASNLLFTCAYWMQSEGLAFGKGDFPRKIPCAGALLFLLNAK